MSLFSALTVRNFRVYATGSLISHIGTWMQNTAQAWLVLILTESGTLLGITLGLQLLPTLIFSPLAGVLADRFDKRRVLIISQVMMAVPSALLGVLAITQMVEVAHVMVLTFMFGVARAFEAPARQAFVPEMVPAQHLGNAVGLNSASFNSGRLIGPAIAGIVIGAFGGGIAVTGWVIMMNALSYFASILALKVLDTETLTPSKPAGSRTRAIRAGVAYVRSRPDFVLALTVVFFVGAFGMNFQITTALMATSVFGHGATEFGLLGTIMAVGSITGALIAGIRPRPRLRFIVIAALNFSALQILSGIMPSYAMYAAVLPFIGLTILIMATTTNTLIQMTADEDMRGRVAALYVMVFLGSVPFGAPVIGWVAEVFGAREALVFSGSMAALGVVAASSWYVLASRGANITQPASTVNGYGRP